MAVRFRVVVLGGERVRAQLERLGMIADKVAGFHLFKGGNDIVNRAKQIVPFITGNLQRSISAEMDGLTAVEIGAGNTAVGYAAKVHEDFAMQQRREARGGRGQWKYIEEPFDEMVDDIIRDFERTLDAEVRKL